MSRKWLAVACGALVALALFIVAPTTRADEFDEASQFTFSHSIELPGHTVLPPGTYWFVLTDAANAPNVVYVYNEDRSNLITAALTFPTYRTESTDRGALVFAQQPQNQPEALMDWYYGDRKTGHQFLYRNPALSEDPQITEVATDVPQGYDEQAQSKEQLRLENADNVMQAALRVGDGIPRALLDQARCVVVMPSVVDVALVAGASYGKGVATCRTGQDFSGSWGAPAMYEIKGGSLGLQIGGQSTDYVLLVMSDYGRDSLLYGTAELGANVSVAAGPVGRVLAADTGSHSRADILTYSRTRGVFAGVSLDGATLRADRSADHQLYGQALTAAEIVTKPKADAPKAGQPLVGLLDQSSPKLVS